ncbi:NAD-dependent succinate-semialdehyde dehydrogenase [Oceanobacillus damuensis]|uniref:NAD-dependent succinate-semialdehyde dehydrogenase n=1 Tax=Oceanobacillus damuensis TaxID=937928 RepID=UPI00082AF677|nr:NAD-dependent succinate-semialdehyde dehydrogenase [Oceanobacillus damuensis]
MYINNQWITTDNKVAIENPSNGEVIDSVSTVGTIETEEAINAASGAFLEWAQLTALERTAYIYKAIEKIEAKRELLAETITMENGKPIESARYEVDSTVAFFKWFAEEARRVYGETIPSPKRGKRLLHIMQPVGVVLAIAPWNFPLSMAARKLAPALAAGCTVILRPSKSAPLSSIELFKIFDEVGFPPGVVNLLIGDADEIVGTAMQDKRVKKVSFTGSTEVGKQLIRQSADTVKRVSMELGGHAPYIVFEDADLDKALEGAIRIKFNCAGQQCTSINRLYVHDKIFNEFSERYVELVNRLKVADGLKEDTDVGPLINQRAIEKVEQQVEDAVKKGAKILHGGNRLTEGEFANGNFYSPTVLTDVNEEMDIYYEETFGPVAPMIRFSEEDEVIQKANDSIYGLGSYMFTNDISRIYRVMEKLDYGIVGVNDPYPFVPEGPFGGVKESGIGIEGGHGIVEYLESKFVSIGINE